MAKITTPDSLYGNSRDILREAERENEILADIAGEEYESPGDIPKGKYVIEKRLLDAAQKKNELLESIAEGGGTGGGGAAKAIGIDYATDIISLKNKDGDVISGSGATLPAYGVSFDPTTGGLTLTKNGTAVQGQTVTIPNYGSPVGVTDSADIVDEGTIYLYEGTTGGGFTNGHFYYYDGSAWADGGEYAAATVQTDKTLLVEDRAADAKATGEAVGELKTQINNITDATNNIFDPDVLLTATGITLDSNGYYTGTANAFNTAFSSGVPELVFEPNSIYYLSLIAYTDANSYEDDSNGIIIQFFDADNTQLARMNLKNNVTTPTKFEKVTVAGSISVMIIKKSSGPENIWHLKDIMFVKSDTAVDYYPHKTAQDLTARNGVEENTQYIDRTNSYIQTDLENKQIIFLNKNELEVGGIKQSDGTNDNTSTQRARTKNYIPLAHSENNFSWAISGYYVGIIEYSLLEDGTFSRINYRYTILNNGVYVPSLGTTHIRLQFQTQNSDYITDNIIQTICDNFIMREGREVNKYLKVCTFNMARLYASLSGADAEGLQKQIRNYLEFIGNFNPHVIQAQEAGGNYWYWDDNHTLNMNTTVFDRKYGFSALPSVGKKTWSQYNFSETEDIAFTHQSSGDNDPRTFTRSYLHFEGKDICILNTHCTYSGDFADARQGQFQELASEMAQHEYCILCGDFNAADVSEFDEFSAFNMANCGDYGVIDTWNIGGTSEWENHAIDNIITTKNILIQNVEIGKYDMEFFSDHVPLVATLKIIDIDSTTT